MKRTGIGNLIFSLSLICVIAVNLTGCGNQVKATNLMDGVEAGNVSGKALDVEFIDSQMNLAVNLLQKSVVADKDKNLLLSPLSIQLALAMTANGADGKTKEEMEKLLGGGICMEELNEYLYTYVNNLPSDKKYKLEIANSIWFRDDEDRLMPEKEFLQINADYYGAQIYKAPFNYQTQKDINNWVEEHTDGIIEKIVDKIDENAVMYLVNALVFDAEWENVYKKSELYDGTFTSISGDKRTAEMMCSKEWEYLNDGKATGFIKEYKDGKYSFAALLPNEGIDIYEYIDGLTSEGLLNTIRDAKSDMVMVEMPKFSYEYEMTMNDILAELGMPTAFDGNTADFSIMGKSAYRIYIGEVLHKTFISVDERGTKAGAVTKVEMKANSAAVSPLSVKLDRPFLYMIIDNTSNLPVFIGTLMDI